MAKTGILIVTYNSASHIGHCLDALRKVMSDGDAVTVLDNASSDATPVEVEARPWARFVQNEANLGFAGALNQGFELLAESVDAILLLNPDVILTTPYAALADACHGAGLAAGRLADSGGATQTGFSFRRFPTAWTLFFETIGVNRIWPSNPVNRSYRCLDIDYDQPQAVDQPAGAMLMISTSLWRRLGGFDEQFYPVWFEDVDFCRRAAAEGFRASYIPSVVGIHEGGHSVLQIPNRDRRRHWYASLLRYSRKHFGRLGWGLVAAGVSAVALIRALGAVLRLHGEWFEEAKMNGMIARTALVYPVSGRPAGRKATAGAANVRGIAPNEVPVEPSTENTERTLKRLHAR